MTLVLHVACTDASLNQAGRRLEVASRLTIGRGPDNDLVLDDPNRHLSKNHCVIDFDGREYRITDTSTNGVFLNHSGERLPRGAAVPLPEGSVIQLGSWEIAVAAVAPGQSAAAPSPIGVDDGLFGDPFADPAGLPSGGALPPSPAPPGLSQPFAPLIPDDADLFGPGSDFGLGGGPTQADHAPSDQAFFAPPRVTTEQLPDDWEAQSFGGLPNGGAARADLDRAAGLPRERMAAMPPLRPSGGEGGDSAALAAFLAALGFAGAAALSPVEKARLMQAAGEALRTVAKGLMEVLAARANTKQEFRIERTMIGARDNNPLKFSGDVDEALRVMLLGKTPGFLAARQAMEEALGDIKSHQLAVLAGMQAGLATVIARFDPAKLEQRMEQRSLLDGVLPGARKARFWDLFKSLYRELAVELEDDFQKAFGNAFARAYKDQLDRL